MPAPKQQTRNQRARAAGIPKSLRRYQKRYGTGGIDALVATHRQNKAPMLDHGRDRAAARKEDDNAA